MCAGCLRISCHPTTHPVRHLQTEHSFFSRWRTKDSQCVFRKPTVTEPILPRNLSYLGADGHCDHCGLWHLLSDILLALCWKNLLARVKGGYQPPPLSLSDTPPKPPPTNFHPLQSPNVSSSSSVTSRGAIPGGRRPSGMPVDTKHLNMSHSTKHFNASNHSEIHLWHHQLF